MLLLPPVVRESFVGKLRVVASFEEDDFFQVGPFIEEDPVVEEIAFDGQSVLVDLLDALNDREHGPALTL